MEYSRNVWVAGLTVPSGMASPRPTVLEDGWYALCGSFHCLCSDQGADGIKGAGLTAKLDEVEVAGVGMLAEGDVESSPCRTTPGNLRGP
jgi:hypothetical protein